MSFLYMALSSGVYVAALLFASATGEGSKQPIGLAALAPTPMEEAPPAAKDTTTMPPDPGDRLGPLVKVVTPGGPHITIVTGGQVPVDPLPAASSQAGERWSGNASSGSDSGGTRSAPKRVAYGFKLQEREKDATHSTSTNAKAAAVRDGVDEQEEQLQPLGCIPCEAMFRKVEDTDSGTKTHNITVQVGRLLLFASCFRVGLVFGTAVAF